MDRTNNADPLEPYAWENMLTGEITKDEEIAFMWEFNRHEVKRLYDRLDVEKAA